MFLAMCGNGEAAAKIAELYLEAALPADKLAKEAKAIEVENQLKEIEQMQPEFARAISDEELMQKARAMKPVFKGQVPRGAVSKPIPLKPAK